MTYYPGEYLESIRRLVEPSRRLYESMAPSLRAMEEMREQVLRPLDRLRAENEAWARQVADLTAATSAESAWVFDMGLRLAEDQRQAAKMITDQMEGFRQTVALPPDTLQGLRHLASMPDSTQRILDAAREMSRQAEEAFRMARLQAGSWFELAESLEADAVELAGAASEDARQKAGLRILGSLTRWVASAPPSRAATFVAMQVVHLVVSLVVALYLVPALDGSRERQPAERRQDLEWQARVDSALAELTAALASRTNSDGLETYEVLSSIPLRAGPGSGNRRKGEIGPATVVEVIGREGRWLEIVFVRDDSVIFETGWIYKRHLQRLPD
jgi:hypothetical protein